MYCISALTTRW